MKNLKLFLVVIFTGLVIISCEKDETDNSATKVKIHSINLSVDKDSLEVGDSIMIRLEILPEQVSDSTVTWSSSDNSIATVTNGLVTGLKAGNIVIYVKANDGSNASDSISLEIVDVLKKATISAKWNVDNSSEYESFEFNESANYIVVKNTTTKSTNDQVVLFGTYEIIDDNTIVLSDFGTLIISDVNEKSINFSIQLESDPDNEIVISALKQDEMESSTNTDLLCQTWEMVTINDTSVVGTEMELTVLFSEAGTYFVSYANPEGENDGGLAQWKWNNEAETQLLYSWEEVPVWEDEDYVEIPELTSTKLKIIEDEDTYVLQPVSNTKSAVIKSSKTSSLGIKSGFFKK